VRRIREKNKEYFNATYTVRDESTINVRDLVLLHNTKRSKDIRITTKISFVWLELYRVLTANYLKGYYTLEDLNSSEIRGTVLGVRLKLYHVRARHIPSILYGE
jgi:hypothetical protein